MNSYFLTYQLVSGPLALFAQVAWGGAFTDDHDDVRHVRSTFESIASLLAVAHTKRSVRDDLRLVVLDCQAKGIDVCTWVALDGQPRPELEWWPRAYGARTALLRGVSELSRHGQSGDEATVADVRVGVEFNWEAIGEVRLENGQLAFPTPLPSGPGLYRLQFSGVNGTSVYIGESSDLRRRAGHYRLGNPGGRTNKRLNDRIREHLAAGGHTSIDLAQVVSVTVAGELRSLDLRKKMSRLLAESAALHAVSDNEVLENLPGIGDLEL